MAKQEIIHGRRVGNLGHVPKPRTAFTWLRDLGARISSHRTKTGTCTICGEASTASLCDHCWEQNQI